MAIMSRLASLIVCKKPINKLLLVLGSNAKRIRELLLLFFKYDAKNCGLYFGVAIICFYTDFNDLVELIKSKMTDPYLNSPYWSESWLQQTWPIEKQDKMFLKC